MAPRKTRTQKTFQFTAQGGRTPQVDADHAGWVTLDPSPAGGGESGTALHLYIRTEDEVGGEHDTKRLEWYPTISERQRELGIEDFSSKWGSDDCTIDYDKGTITFAEDVKLPPPDRAANLVLNQKANKAHVRAMGKLLDVCLVGSKRDLVKLIQAYDNPHSVSISSSMSDEDIESHVAEVKEAREKVQGIHDALKGIDNASERKALLRHVAHVFDIPKGDTSLR